MPDQPRDPETDETYECAECGKTFDTLPSLRGHAGGTGHSIYGSGENDAPTPRTALSRAVGLMSDGEVGKLDLLSFAFGALAGIFLAHEPSILGNIAVAGGIAVTAYRVFLRATDAEMGVRGIQYLDTFVAGCIFGFVGVEAAHEGRALDWLAHGLGTHTH